MKKWLASIESKKITVIIFILCMVLVMQITSFLNFNRRLYDMTLTHSTQQVDELSMYVEQNFHLELKHYIQILKITGIQLEQQDNLFEEGTVKLLDEMQEISRFNLVGVSDLDGAGLDSTGAYHQIADEHMRESVENGEVYISNALKSENEMNVFIAVPLSLNGGIGGILWGSVPLSDMIEEIDLKENSHKYFQIVDDGGNYLLTMSREHGGNPQPSGSNMWEELSSYQYEDGISAERISASMQRGECGSFCFESDGQGYYANYRPLGINRWYLFSVQEQDELHSYVNSTREIMAHFFLILTVGLLTIFATIYHLIYTMYRNTAKQHLELQTINTMFQATLYQTNHVPFVLDRTRRQVVLYGYPAKGGVQYLSFADISPERIEKKGLIDQNSLEEYRRLYQRTIVEGAACEPVVIYSRLGTKKEWIRISIVSDSVDGTEQMIGVMEGYSEQKKKDLQIENHLDDIKKMEKRFQIDFLTKLYNRGAFIENVQRALQENQDGEALGAFLILDIDYFKRVNDCMGHSMGDFVLQKTADILRSFFRTEDIVGRLGGDEFVVFAKNIQNVSAFERRLSTLNQLLSKTYSKNGESVHVSASIGIVLTDNAHDSFPVLYEKADAALYKVKQMGRNGYCIYSDCEAEQGQ